MAQNFQTIPHRDISKGIDQRSAPNAVKPGFAEDMRNLDTNSTGFVEKRKGYQGYKGSLPLRMESLEVNGALANLEFNSDINLLLTPSSPVVVYGEVLQSGTGTIVSSGTTITGTGTLFTSELVVGSVLIAGSESQVVESIASDTSLTVGASFSPDLTSTAFTHRTTKEYYWTGFLNDSRKVTAASSIATYNVNHGLGNTAIAASVVHAPTTNSLDNFTIIPDSIVSGPSVNEIDVTIDNTGNIVPKDFYILIEDSDNTSVVSYRATISEALVSGAMTHTISAATHNLPNLHVLPFFYAEISAGEYHLSIPDTFTVKANGDIEITVLNADNTVGGSSTFEGQIVLIDVPGDQSLEGSYAGGDGKTLVFTGVAFDFSFYALYDRDVSGNQSLAIPDSIFHDQSTDEVTVTFDLPVSKNLKLVYNPAVVKSNVISVDATLYPELLSDTTPSVSLWGVPHSDIVYQDDVTQGSWTNSIEEYSSQGTNKLVVGMGGVLHEETTTNSGVTLPSYFVDMRRRTEVSKTIGPFFGAVSTKDRGIESPLLNGTSVNINSITNNGDATATLDLSLGAKYGSLSTLITTLSTTGNDRIDIVEASNPEYIGTFDVSGVSETLTYAVASSFGLTGVVQDSSTSVTFTFDNNANAVAFHAAYLSDTQVWSWKDVEGNVFIMTVAAGGGALLDPLAGTTITVTTTSVILSGTQTDFSASATTIFATDDTFMTLEDSGTSSSITIAVAGLPTYVPSEASTGATGTIFTDGVEMSEFNEVGASADLPFLLDDIMVGTLFTGTSPSVIGVDSAAASTRRLYLNNLTVNTIIPAGAQFSSSRTTTTHVLTSVEFIVRGDTLSANGFERQFQVVDVVAATNTVTLDESITLSDDPANRDFMAVTGRWKAIEAPSLNDRPISYFDQNGINNQARLRGVSINDSIFYTNYDDDVMKYDGDSLYRAGLPSWQPRVQTWVDNDSAGIPAPTFSYVGALASDDSLNFATMPDLSGVTEIYLEANGALTAGLYDIKSVNETDKKIVLDFTIASDEGNGKIVLPQQASYYFKLQMIDRNNNLVASAVTDFQECVVDITQSGTVTHRLTGLPEFDIYDYDRIDLLVFRTKIGRTATPPFYQVKRVPLNFELFGANNSITITDTVPDESLPPFPDDTVSIALKGAELPLSSEAPPRAKYVESIGNRLVLGNVKSYNKVDVTLRSDSGITETNVLSNATVNIADGNNGLTFEYMALVDAPATDLNVANNILVDTIDYTTSTSFSLTVDNTGVPFADGEFVGKFIQLSSFYMDVSNGDLYSGAGRTRASSSGHVMGWWKVTSHSRAASVDTITIKHTHGLTSAVNFDFSVGSPNPIYLTFPDTANSNIPIVAAPYAISAVNRIVENIVYDDTTNALEFTNAINRGVIDLKRAFNRVMVEETSPWALALSGTTEGSGRIIFESALPGDTLTATILEGGGTDLEIFINNIKRASGDSVSGITRVFPSRVLVSSPNFPEMFDNPFGATVSESDSLLDINSDDGQEITGLATFFAESTGTTSGQLGSILVVFKNKSIYTIDTTTREVQKLESMGQGCTVPDSISSTQNGIMFANQSGIYKVGRDLTVTYVGRWLERSWENDVNDAAVESRAVGYTDSVNRKYKLSVPLSTSVKNSDVLVLDYIVEDNVVDGAWTRYDNFAAAGWVQTNTNSYFCNYVGQVFALRKAGNNTDYRDDASGIASTFTYGAQSFGDSGTRTAVNRVISHFHAETDLTGASLDVAIDMSSTFEGTDTVSFTGIDPKVQTIATSIPKRHGLYFQVKYTHATKDQKFILSGIDFKVQGLDESGINQATEN